MAASFNDLAPSEKKKVARLIQQVVEERALREQVVEEQALREREQAALADQNTKLAGENASLRAQLAYTFDLLRGYQLRCRTLDAAAHIPNPGLHPASPGCASPVGATAAAQSLAETSAHPLMQHPGTMHSNQGAPCDAPEPAAMRPMGSKQPNPSAAGVETEERHSASPGAGKVASHPQPLSVAPHLEALKVLAQALLEAQAAVVAKQHHQLLQQPPMLPSAEDGGCLRCDASVACHGGQIIPCLPLASTSVSGSACSSSSTGYSGCIVEQRQLEGEGGSERSAAMAAPGCVTTRSRMPGAQYQASPAQQLDWASGCSGRVAMFDDSLMGLVRDVESMMPQQLPHRSTNSAMGAGSEQLGGEEHSKWSQLGAAAYEENDLLALLESL